MPAVRCSAVRPMRGAALLAAATMLVVPSGQGRRPVAEHPTRSQLTTSRLAQAQAFSVRAEFAESEADDHDVIATARSRRSAQETGSA
jgi:hypothetical protein